MRTQEACLQQGVDKVQIKAFYGSSVLFFKSVLESSQFILPSFGVENQIALLAASFGVMQFVFVLTFPCEFCSSSFVITSAAETFGIVLSLNVLTLSDDLSHSIAFFVFFHFNESRWDNGCHA